MHRDCPWELCLANIHFLVNCNMHKVEILSRVWWNRMARRSFAAQTFQARS